MSWTTPKTNWVATDKFNASDYNRITNNLLALKELVDRVVKTDKMNPMETEKTYEDMFYARHINVIEDNLERLNNSSYVLNIGDKTTYLPNQPTPLYTEYNRIESAMFDLYEQVSADLTTMNKLAFTLGGAKRF